MSTYDTDSPAIRRHRDAERHTRDSDCTVDPDTNACTVCWVEHGPECPDCGRAAYHERGCSEVDPMWPLWEGE